MKKILTITALLLCFITQAQGTLEPSKLQLNAGFATSGWDNPIYFGADYGLQNNFTIGAEVSYQTYKSFGIKSTIIGLQANGNYHFNEILELPSEWDLYGGLSLNYYYWNTDIDGGLDFVDDESFGLGAQIGGRYFFNDKFGINLEVGGGNATSGGKIGVTYKL